MNLITKYQDIRFLVDTCFDIKHLFPVQKHVQWKLENKYNIED